MLSNPKSIGCTIMEPIEEVTLLYEITKALNEHLDLKKSLYKVLDILSNSMNMVRGTITLLNPLRNEINIEVAHGISPNTMQRVKYKLGEGITSRVIESGKAGKLNFLFVSAFRLRMIKTRAASRIRTIVNTSQSIWFPERTPVLFKV